MAAWRDILEELVAFHRYPLPRVPPEYRTSAILVKGLAYVLLAATFLSPAAGFLGYTTGNQLLLLAAIGVIPAFVVLAYAYPSFVRGERWSLFAVSLVGLAFLALAPARFLTEAASRRGIPAVPPTTAEWIVFVGSALFLYLVLSPESRHGMRMARMRASPVERGRSRYVCPECGRVYALERSPPVGTLCPHCRRKGERAGPPRRGPSRQA